MSAGRAGRGRWCTTSRRSPREDEKPFDEHVIALEYLLAAIELIIAVRGTTPELDALRTRTEHVLTRASTD